MSHENAAVKSAGPAHACGIPTASSGPLVLQRSVELGDRLLSVMETLEQRLRPVMLEAAPETTGVGADRHPFPPLFAAMREQQDRLESMIDHIENLASRVDV